MIKNLALMDLEFKTVATVVGNADKSSSVFTTAEIITLISIGVTFFTVLFTSYQTNVTKNRMQWINDLRELGAQIITFNYKISEKDKLADFNNNANQFILMLNVKGQFDRVIASFLRSIVVINRYRDENKDESYNSDEYNLKKNCFSFALQLYLKVEWERVKKEAKIWSTVCRILRILLKKKQDEFQELLNEFLENDPVINKIQIKYNEIKELDEDGYIEPTPYTGYVVMFPSLKRKSKKKNLFLKAKEVWGDLKISNSYINLEIKENMKSDKRKKDIRNAKRNMHKD